MACCGSVIRKKRQKSIALILIATMGGKVLNDSGLYGIRMVAIDKDWSALRFRNKKYIKSTSNRFTK